MESIGNPGYSIEEIFGCDSKHRSADGDGAGWMRLIRDRTDWMRLKEIGLIG